MASLTWLVVGTVSQELSWERLQISLHSPPRGSLGLLLAWYLGSKRERPKRQIQQLQIL